MDSVNGAPGGLQNRTNGGPSLKSFIPVALFVCLGILIVWNLLLPGYLFTIDGVVGPASIHKSWIDHLRGIGPNLSLRGMTNTVEMAYYGATYLLNTVLPSWIILSLPLLAVLSLAGIGMYRLTPARSVYARFFAGALYMVNPFIYARVLSGAFWFIWGYAFLPFLAKSLIDLFESPGWRPAAKSGLWLAVLAPSPHFLAIAFVLLGALFASRLLARQVGYKLALSVAGACLLFAIVNAGWLYSTISGTGSGSRQLASVTQHDLALFSARPSGHGLFDLAAMYGFWRNFDYPKYHIPGWEVVFSGLLFLVIVGFLFHLKGHGSLNAKVMALLCVVGLLLGSGVGFSRLSGMNLWLYSTIPMLGAFRDSQKFVAFLALGYAYLGSLGLDTLRKVLTVARQGRRLWPGVAAVSVGLVFLYTYTMFFGLGGRLPNVDYPKEYYQARDYLDGQTDAGNLLFLPWHQSLVLSWTNTNVANPAQDIFDQPVISGDNVELPGIYSESTNPVSKYVENILIRRESMVDFGRMIAPLGVKYVVLAKETDWENYEFLLKQRDLITVLESPHLILLKNASYPFLPGQQLPAEVDASLAASSVRQLEEYRNSKVWWGYIPTGLVLVLTPIALLITKTKRFRLPTSLTI